MVEYVRLVGVTHAVALWGWLAETSDVFEVDLHPPLRFLGYRVMRFLPLAVAALVGVLFIVKRRWLAEPPWRIGLAVWLSIVVLATSYVVSFQGRGPYLLGIHVPNCWEDEWDFLFEGLRNHPGIESVMGWRMPCALDEPWLMEMSFIGITPDGSRSLMSCDAEVTVRRGEVDDRARTVATVAFEESC